MRDRVEQCTEAHWCCPILFQQPLFHLSAVLEGRLGKAPFATSGEQERLQAGADGQTEAERRDTGPGCVTFGKSLHLSGLLASHLAHVRAGHLILV